MISGTDKFAKTLGKVDKSLMNRLENEMLCRNGFVSCNSYLDSNIDLIYAVFSMVTCKCGVVTYNECELIYILYQVCLFLIPYI